MTAAAQAPEPHSFADLETDPRLGERVERICSVTIRDFAVTTRDTLLIEAGQQGWYLLRTNNCQGMETAVSLQLRQSGRCLDRGDGVQPMDSLIPGYAHPLDPNHVRARRNTQLPACQIREIYQWSPRAAHEAL